jgi:uncharacterized protein GlcG (DUF336 family)
MTPFNTQQLLAALDAAMTEGHSLHGAFAICVVDDGGHPIAQLRHPDATVAATDSALSKARTAIWLGADTGGVPATAPIVPALVSGLPWPVNLFPGGRVLRDGARRIGAIGVGGSTNPADDTQVATAALQVLSPQP